MLFTKQKLKEIHHNSQIIPPDYFLIGTHTSEKVLDANYGCLMWDYLGYDSQLWFWDGTEIHSKKYPNFVLDVDSKIAVENGWSRLTLFPKACGLKRNQWKIEGNMMISDYEDLRLDIRKSDGEKGAVVGYSSRNSKLNKDSQYEAELYSENYLFIFKPLALQCNFFNQIFDDSI